MQRTTRSRLVPRRLLVIYNPAAGRNPRRRLDAILDHLRALGSAVVLRETAARGDAEAIARGADPAAFDAVAAAGGDGTINEIVNGLAKSGLPLAILPLGTGNVLANELGLPHAPRRLAELAAFGRERPIWTGEIGARRFVAMAGIGFDAAVVAGLDEGLKRRIGKLAFVWEILVQLWRYEPRRFHIVCGESEHRPASAVIAKGRFYAGRFVLAPAARIDEPALHLVLFGRTGRGAALLYLAALGLGLTHRLRDVTILRTQSLTILGPVGLPVEGDGDVLAHLPVTIRVSDRPILAVRPG
ncbi:MAG: lipid kinase [Rhodospirillales bacterium]|nr:lipid kinase [Rhodospirillales bacterium]